MECLVEIMPRDPVTDARVTLRAASADDGRITGLNGVQWWPAIIKKPSLSHSFFDGDFTGTLSTGAAALELAMFGLKRQDPHCPRYRYGGAAVNIYAADAGAAWPWPLIFTGVVDSFGNKADTLSLSCKVNVAPFAGSALTATYAGSGGAEGGADLKGKVKPWALGSPRNVEPVLIDATNQVYQVSGYGPITGFDGVFEKGASFGAAVGDLANYAALVAATVPSGRWASCLAAGMFRLGAPAAGVITADVQGDASAGYPRRTGAIISRIMANAGVPGGNIDAASLAALDAAVPRNISIYLTEQTKLIDIADALAKPCNAAAGVSWLGKLFVTRMGIGAAAITLDAQARQKPAVIEAIEDDVSPPYARIEMQGARNWRVQSASEIAYFATIVPSGDYASGATYREGNVVADQRAAWLYVNPVAAAGNPPPVLPTTSNSYWSLYNAPDSLHLADIAGLGTLAGQNAADFATQVTGGAKPANNATRNITTYSATAPSTPVDGDLWVNTSGTYAVFELRSGGAWIVGANALTAYNALSGTPVALADINTTESTKLAGISAGADVTLANVPTISGPATTEILCDYTGTPLAGQLPRDVLFTRAKGGVDVTTSTAWTASVPGTLTATIGASTGDLNITTPISGGGAIVVTGTRDGVALTFALVVKKTNAPAPSSGGAGSSSASTSAISSTNSSSYGAANAGPLTITAGASGTATLSAPLGFTVSNASPAGTGIGLIGKWQWRVSGGTFADAATEIAQSSTESVILDGTSYIADGTGALTINMTKTGLTPGSVYDFQLLLRTGGSQLTRAHYASGTASVSTS